MPEFRSERAFVAKDAFVPDPAMAGEEAVRFEKSGQWCSFKGYFAAGEYRIELLGDTPEAGGLEVFSFENQLVARVEVADLRAGFSLPEDGKYWLRMRMPVGSRVQSVRLSRFQHGSE